MAIILVDDPKDNFWQKNPSISYISPFADFKKEYGSRFTSRIMNAIYLIHDPKSELRNSGMSDDEILIDVNTNFLKRKHYDWNKYEYLIDAYLNKLLNKEEKLLLEHEAELVKRNEFLEKWPWDKKDAKDKNSLMMSTKKLFDDYLDIKKKVKQEQKTERYRGDYEPSLTELVGHG